MTREKDEAAILALERAYDAAWNAGDVRALIGLFTADAVVVNPRGEIARGRVELERVLGRFLLGPARGSTHASMVASVRFVVDDVAIVDGEATLAGLPDSSAPFVHQFTDVVIGVDGDWAIAHVRAYVFSGR